MLRFQITFLKIFFLSNKKLWFYLRFNPEVLGLSQERPLSILLERSMPYLSLKKEIEWGNKFLLHIAKWIKKFLFSITSAWQRKIIDTFSLLHLFKTAFFHSNNNESTLYNTDVIPIKKNCDYCMLDKWPKNLIVVYFPIHLNQYVFPDVKENILD